MEHISLDKIPILITCILKDEWDEIENNINKQLFSGRFSGYSIISDYVEELEDDQRDILQVNACKHRNKCLKIQVNNESLDNIEKLLEHILLEVPRASQNSKIKKQLTRNELMNRKFRDESKNFTGKIDKHEIKMDKMQGEFISILSIFSAIIIAFFGGINLLGSALTNIDKCSKYRLIAIVLIIGLIMFNIIYMLLYTISRLIRRNIGSRRKEKLCKECNENLDLKCLIIKYPLVFFYNFIILILILAISILYVVDAYNLIAFIIVTIPIIPNTIESVGIIGIIITIIFLVIMHSISKNLMKWFNCNPNKCNLNQKEAEIEKNNVSGYDTMFEMINNDIALDSINPKDVKKEVEKNKNNN